MELAFFFYFYVFLVGLAIGSFLNSVIHRLHTGESFLFAPLKSRRDFFSGFAHSYCPHCKHKLSWQDLIPVLSFLIVRGKCRYCKKKISVQYPLVELATAILFVLVLQSTIINQRLSIFSIFLTCYLLLITCYLIIIFVYDLKHYIIPDKIIYPAIAITFFYNLFIHFNPKILSTKFYLLNTLSAAFGAGAFFLFIVLISKGRWMGVGDIKLAFFMGFFLSFPDILVALFLAFFIGAIIGIGLILIGKKTLKSEVPFGPFLVTGTFIAFFFGTQIVNWYLRILR